MILDRINAPEDVKKLKIKEKKELASEIREFLVDKVSQCGGHLSSNLGVVELTIALLTLMSQTCDYLSTLLKRSYTYNRFEKIASFLLEVTQIDNPNKNIIHNTIPYTHEEISTIVGLSRVTTTKVLNEFQKKGYIKIEYKKITVLNKEALSKLIR